VSNVYEKVSAKTGSGIRKETRETVTKVAESIIKDLVDRGFRDKDVREYVRDGVYDANHNIKK
jgi:hypothetical protein